MALSQSAHILVVDDQPISVAVTEAALLRLGFRNIDTARSAGAAFESIRHRKYDLILSDWHMPEMDGPELFRQVKSAAGLKRPKFFFLTGDNGWASRVTTRELGADGLLIKPARPQDLVRTLSQALLVH